MFVFYALKDSASQIKTLAGGAATPIINKSSFSSVKLQVPSLPTQHRIASILSTYDDLIENNTRRIAILEEMARRLYEEWFAAYKESPVIEIHSDQLDYVTNLVDRLDLLNKIEKYL